MRLLLCQLLFSAAFAADVDAGNSVIGFPDLPHPSPVAAADLGALQSIGAGIATGKGVIALDGSVIMDQGPVDGLEVFACLEGGKTHESFVRLATGDALVLKLTFAAVLGLSDGVPVEENNKKPARGTPLRVLAQWQTPGKSDETNLIDASCLVRDRISDRPYPPLPYVYTGSRLVRLQELGDDGNMVWRERFMLESTKSLIVNYNEPDALLASPFPGADADQHFEVNSAIAPPPKTPIRLIVRRAELPLTLHEDADGNLRADPKAEPLDDAAVSALLGRHFGDQAKPDLRAVGIAVDAATDSAKDIEVRARLLGLARAAKAWVVPVWVCN